MKESIKTYVLLEPDEGKEVELDITYEDDALDFILEGRLVFSGDWSGNFFNVFKRALDLWQEYA